MDSKKKEDVGHNIVNSDGGEKNNPERGEWKIDPWDGKWKKEKDFYFPYLGDDSLSFLFFLLEGGP